MIKNIIYRLASGVLFMLTALFLCAATGLGVFFPIKIVGNTSVNFYRKIKS